MAEFNAEMKARLAAYQRAQGLSGDGVAGPKTWATLSADVGGMAAVDVTETTAVDVTETTATDVTETTARPESSALDGMVRLDPAKFPLAYSLAEQPKSPEGGKNFLRKAGIDVDAILADMDRVLNSPTVD